MKTDQRHGRTRVALDIDAKVRPVELLRVQRLARELRLTDQILSTDLEAVEVLPSGPAPAWTTLDGDKVTFAYDHLPKLATTNPMNVAIWLGTNAHELGHVLFSPRKDSTLMFRVIESDRTFLRGMATLHNIVEDQRQERLLLARFSPWTGYLTAALGFHLHVDDGAWLLMAGRTWLPDNVRDQARAAFLAKHGAIATQEVTRIVGEYQRLTDPGDLESDEAWQLLQELHALLADDIPQQSHTCTVMSGGEPDTGQPGDDAPMTADEADEAREGNNDGETGADDADDDSDDGNGDGDDGDDEGDDADDADNDGAGSSASNTSMKPDDVKRQLRDAAQDQIEQDEEASDDLSNILDSLENGRPDDAVEGSRSIGNYQDANEAALRLHRDVADALLDLKDESEPGWLKRTDSGRLNIRRLLDPNADADVLFDRYEPGMMDASEMEVVLLLDVSASMHRQLLPVAEAAWAIRQAVNDLEGRSTVLTYETGHQVFATANEPPDGRMFVPDSRGGTNPKTALAEAFRVLAGSQAKNRLLVILTDGDWEAVRPCEDIIAAMNECGVTTICALLGAAAGVNTHKCTFGAVIDDPTELARLFRRVAVERIRSNF